MDRRSNAINNVHVNGITKRASFDLNNPPNGLEESVEAIERRQNYVLPPPPIPLQAMPSFSINLCFYNEAMKDIRKKYKVGQPPVVEANHHLRNLGFVDGITTLIIRRDKRVKFPRKSLRALGCSWFKKDFKTGKDKDLAGIMTRPSVITNTGRSKWKGKGKHKELGSTSKVGMNRSKGEGKGRGKENKMAPDDDDGAHVSDGDGGADGDHDDDVSPFTQHASMLTTNSRADGWDDVGSHTTPGKSFARKQKWDKYDKRVRGKQGSTTPSVKKQEPKKGRKRGKMTDAFTVSPSIPHPVLDYVRFFPPTTAVWLPYFTQQEVSPEWWGTLIGEDSLGWLDAQHMEVILAILSEDRPLDARWVIMPPGFMVFGSSGMDESWATGEAPNSHVWYGCDRVYFPLNLLLQEHWVAVELDLVAWKFTIFDSMPPAASDGNVEAVLKLSVVAERLPTYLDTIRFWHHSERERPEQLKCTIQMGNDIPRQDGTLGDCGILTCMNIEALSRGQQLDIPPPVHPHCLRYRHDMAHKLLQRQVAHL